MNDEEMLDLIYQNAEMGVEGIDHVLPYVQDGALRRTLNEQRTEYQKTCLRSDELLLEKGYEPHPSAGPLPKLFSRLSAEFKANTDPSPSHIAEMLIRGSALGAAKLVRHLHDYAPGDRSIQALAEQQLHTTQDNIEQIKEFL